jgi:rfaE bifunctional protein nucleotidyltransferase chain/domain
MESLKHIESKILGWEPLQKQLALWRFRDRKIVFTNGVFDILHLGHIDYLSKARDLGNLLVIGLNSDDSVHRIKGPNRPLNSELARAMVLASLTFVDAVVLFEEETPLKLIKLVKPDFLVKGKDYKEHEIAGSDFVKSYGGKVVTIELVKGYSTSHLIEKAKKSHN